MHATMYWISFWWYRVLKSTVYACGVPYEDNFHFMLGQSIRYMYHTHHKGVMDKMQYSKTHSLLCDFNHKSNDRKGSSYSVHKLAYAIKSLKYNHK